MKMHAMPAGLQRFGLDTQQHTFGSGGNRHRAMRGTISAFEVATGGKSRKDGRNAEHKTGGKGLMGAHLKSCFVTPLPG
jgi:hypothetical protein